jgi:hypothetical protein
MQLGWVPADCGYKGMSLMISSPPFDNFVLLKLSKSLAAPEKTLMVIQDGWDGLEVFVGPGSNN